ncbi:DUF3099 domain-containing protein [Actinocorallia longicatena]|uniref:DUF3099 domain-containing protein n=1 Tax=Actinocorallia longicatena TaxID=111803 RepID=UPI0031D54F7A
MRALPRRKATVYNITDAAVPLSEDVNARQRRYLISMGIRTICFFLAVVTYGHVPTAVMALLIIGAIFLPYVSVIFANGGRRPTKLPSHHHLTNPTVPTAPGTPRTPAQKQLPAPDPQSGA